MAEREAGRVTIEELTERIRSRGRVRNGVSAAEVIREMRDAGG
jgi:hypothetical protein